MSNNSKGIANPALQAVIVAESIRGKEGLTPNLLATLRDKNLRDVFCDSLRRVLSAGRL